MPPDTLELRRRAIDDLDVGGLLGLVVIELGRLITTGAFSAAEAIITSWEQAFGSDIEDLSTRAKALVGRPNEPARRSAFAAAHAWMTPSLNQLAFVINRRSRQGIDRWGWIARSYRDAIERYVAQRELSYANHEAVAPLRERVSQAGARDDGVFRVMVDHHARVVKTVTEHVPALVRHCFDRVELIITESDRVRADLEDGLRRRAWLQQQAEPLLTSELQQGIDQLRSVAEQASAYARLIRENEREIAARDALASVACRSEELVTVERAIASLPVASISRLQHASSAVEEGKRGNATVAQILSAPPGGSSARKDIKSPDIATASGAPNTPALGSSAGIARSARASKHANRDAVAEQRFRRGLSMIELGLSDEALHEFEAVIARVPGDVPAMIGAALMLDRAGEGRRAVSLAERAVVMNPPSRLARIAWLCMSLDGIRVRQTAADLREMRAAGEVDDVIHQLLQALVVRARRGERR